MMPPSPSPLARSTRPIAKPGPHQSRRKRVHVVAPPSPPSTPFVLSLPRVPCDTHLHKGDTSNATIHSVSTVPPLLCAATHHTVCIFRMPSTSPVANATNHANRSIHHPVLVAQWTPPSNISVKAAVLSPDCQILVVLVTNLSQTTAALALLSPTTCIRRLRIALPSSVARALCSDSIQNPQQTRSNREQRQLLSICHETLTFVSPNKDSLACSSVPPDMSSSRLRRVFPPRVIPPPANVDISATAPWALALKVDALRFVQILTFHPGYRRLLHSAYVPFPTVHDNTHPVVHAVHDLQQNGSRLLAAVTPHTAFIAKGISFKEAVSQSDISMSAFAAVSHGHYITISTRADGTFALVEHTDRSLHIFSTALRATDVCAVRLVRASDDPRKRAFVIAIPQDGIPRIVARVRNQPEQGIHIEPVGDLSPENNPDSQRWPCSKSSPVSISIQQPVAIVAFACNGQIVVRFLNC